jgi:NAD+ synthase
MNPKYSKTQTEIIQALHVGEQFDEVTEAKKRIDFIKNQLQLNNQKSLVLGISGGIDSTLTGRLAQLAVEQLREENYPAHFIAVRLPYGRQVDEEDAECALDFINPDQIMIVNIKKTCDEMIEAIISGHFQFADEYQKDLVLANIKARERMVAQYALANAQQGLVIGTDHAAEALMGFFTKFGDGACDIAPLQGLNKRRIKKIASYLDAPHKLITKTPTADLENLNPQKSDEVAYGITYEEIDDFLEGKEVPERVYRIIIDTYNKSEHKRNLPAHP